ncbi:MAG: LacI family DNA-binding transcriptional regulator [Roseiarcus sp.]
MGKRPTLADLARAAGVSVATVDRVLNGRHRVREPTAERVLGAAEAIGFHGAPLIKRRVRLDAPTLTFGFLLQKPDAFYRRLGADLEAATARLADVRGKAIVEYVSELSPATIAERLLRMGEAARAIGVVSVDHPHVSEAIVRLRARDVPTFAMLSDLTAEARAGYVGRDNRKEGRTAAWIVARAAARPGKIGIIVGSHRYLCQETAEISFRAYLREHAPAFQPLEPLVNLEDSRLAYAATQELLARHPDLVGFYVCGGGMEGAIAAARDEARREPLAVVCNELTPMSRAALIDGVLSAIISTPTALLADRALEAMARALAVPAIEAASQIVVPFDLFLPTNI